MKRLLKNEQAYPPVGDIVAFRTSGNPANPPLLLLHGYMVDGRMYDPLVEYMEEEFFVIQPDHRGYGQSASMEGPYTVEQMALDMVKLLNHLHIEKVNLMGYSKGGLIAQKLTLQYPDRVNAISLAVTFAHKVVSPLERMQKRFLPSVIKRIGAEGMSRMMYDSIAGGMNFKPHEVRAFKKMLANCRDDVLLQTGFSLFKFDSREELHKIEQPALIIGGAEDFVVPVHHSKILKEGIPNAKLKVFERAGHGMIFTHTEKLARFTKNFFRKHNE